MVPGAGGDFSYLIFPMFIIFTLGNYFLLYIWRNIFFLHNFMKKSYSKLSVV